jgi:hypothetical protein
LSQNPVDVDFEILSEDWTKYNLSDNTVLRVKILVLKLVQSEGDTGVPNFGAGAQNIVAASVPQTMLKHEGDAVPIQTEDIKPEDIKAGIELEFQPVREATKWQEYKTSTGWLVMVRPEVGRVVRLRGYVPIGKSGLLEPAYWANIQSAFRIKKA